MNKNIVVGINPFLVTFRCNLRCKLCCTGTPYKANPDDYSLELLKTIAKREFAIVSYIHKLSLGGGEPILHRNLPDFIEFLMDFDTQFEVLEILTNGVASPNDDFYRVINKYKEKIFIFIDDYGSISKSAKTIVDNLNTMNINYERRCYYGENAYYGGWLDQGNFNHKFSKNEAIKNMKKCILVSTPKNKSGVSKENWKEECDNNIFIRYITTVGGKCARCARAISTYEKGIIPNSKNTFVDLLDGSKSNEQIQDELIDLFTSEYYLPCEYCSGYSPDGERYPPAEQL